MTYDEQYRAAKRAGNVRALRALRDSGTQSEPESATEPEQEPQPATENATTTDEPQESATLDATTDATEETPVASTEGEEPQT